MRFTKHLLPSTRGSLGVLTLNNPDAFHSLTLDMMSCMEDVLSEWTSPNSSVRALWVESAANTKRPSFCAGGDVKQICLYGMNNTHDSEGNPIVHGQGRPGLETSDFFRNEYRVNCLLHERSDRLNQTSIWDGIAMGGGLGISIFGKYRVATENTLLAMPETAIGLVPDIGCMYWMTRTLAHNQDNDGLAVYLSLTGQRIHAYDAYSTGLATHYVPSQNIATMKDDLVKALEVDSNEETIQDDALSRTPSVVESVLQSFHQEPPESNVLLVRNKEEIESLFGNMLDRPSSTVEELMERLQNNRSSSFAQTTLESLKTMSPRSLKVTLEGLKRGKQHASLREDLRMEYRMAQGCMRNRDFYEGIRAALIDKDKSPKWDPPSLEQVTKEMVDSYFEPIEHELEMTDEATSRL